MKPAQRHRPHVNRMSFVVVVAAAIATHSIGVSETLAQADEIGPAYYLGIGFALLDADERVLFVEIAEEQACPCPGTTNNLSECLLDFQGRCRLAENVGSLIMRRIKEDLSTDEIASAVEIFITEALTPREFNLESAPSSGPADAPIQLVIFSEFLCPHCRRLADVVEELSNEFGDQLVVYYKHFPLPQHANAMIAARACVAAQQQDRFWEMHDILFEHQAELQSSQDPDAFVQSLAEEIGLDIGQFGEDFASQLAIDIPTRDLEEGRDAGVNGTPTCFINGLEYLDAETIDGLTRYFNGLL